MIFGSPGYAAPEQYGKAQTTPAADIYSLGALLHQLLTGIDPAENPFRFAPLRLYGTDGLGQLDALIQSMVSLHVAQRPTSIKEVRAELQDILSQQQPTRRYSKPITPPVSNTGTGSRQQQIQRPAPPVAKTTGRRKVLQGMLALGVLSLSLRGIGGYLFNHYPSAVVYNDQHAGPGPQQLEERFIAAGHYQDPGEINVVRYAPNHNAGLVAAGNIHGVVRLLDSVTTSVLASISIATDSIMDLSWSYDGKYLACSTRKAVYIVEITDSRTSTNHSVQFSSPKLVFSGEPQWIDTDTTIYTIAWSPQEYRLAVSDYTFTTRLLQFDPNKMSVMDIGHYPDKQPTNPSGINYATNQLAWSPDGAQLVSPIASARYNIWQTKDQTVLPGWSADNSISGNMVGWQTNSPYPITLISNNSVYLEDTHRAISYTHIFPENIADFAYRSSVSAIFIALANGDIYYWKPQEAGPRLIKNGDDTLAALNSITASPEHSLAVAFSDGNIIFYDYYDGTGPQNY
ncbi:hypothetical protein KDK_71890 [Dictyobacter kobayashii]|uniref:Protein kinase domain-containing protein n=2 Tax=Dictyobacter kobayashii TaxID=2014872 RepID=A0A402AWC8_9CHLR|nr:hypothetical protein KDK_71890 [Dictyobacter kobayashii]